MGGIIEGGTISRARFCMVCGGDLPVGRELVDCENCHLIYKRSGGMWSADYLKVGIADPKDCLNNRLTALEKKVAESDWETMKNQPLSSLA